MKAKGLKMAAAAAALAGLCVGVAEARNMVGYIKVEVPAGLSMMSVPFEPVGGGAFTLEAVLGNAPADTVLLLFTGSGYEVYNKDADAGWQDDNGDDAGNLTLPRGGGFWIWNVSGNPFNVVLRGQVPTQPISQNLETGLQIVSYGFPSAAPLSSYGPSNPEDGDMLMVFAGSTYTIYTYVDGEWVDDDGNPAGLVFEPGKAYWYWALTTDVMWGQSPNF